MDNSIILTLLPSTLDRDALLTTFTLYNSARNEVSAVAHKNKCFNKHKLSELLYYSLRDNFHLPSQLAVSCIGTVVHDYKNHQSRQLEYTEFQPMHYDKRSISFKGLTITSVSTTIGRLDIPFTVIGYQNWSGAPKQTGYSKIFYEDDSFIIHSVIT